MYTVMHRPDGSFELRTHVPVEELSPRAVVRLRGELLALLDRLSRHPAARRPPRHGPPRRLRAPEDRGRNVPAPPGPPGETP